MKNNNTIDVLKYLSNKPAIVGKYIDKDTLIVYSGDISCTSTREEAESAGLSVYIHAIHKVYDYYKQIDALEHKKEKVVLFPERYGNLNNISSKNFDSVFPIKELKDKLEQMNIIDKLKKLRDENPNFADVIEKEFPEIIDNEPFVYSGTLFMRKQNRCEIFCLYWNIVEQAFKVKAIKDNEDWHCTQKSTSKEETYLSKKDFSTLLNKAGVNIKNISIIIDKDLQNLHKTIFTR